MTNKEFTFARKILKRTQKQMAELLGTSKKTISSYEQGYRNIPIYVERQIYFLISRRKNIASKIKACWEVKHCDEKIRAKCPAMEFNLGHMCWFISGTFCNQCRTDSPVEKLSICRGCEAFRPIAELLEYQDAHREKEKESD